MKEIKEIDKNRKAKFERLLTDFLNNRIGTIEILAKSSINKDLFGLTEQYLTHAKRDIMSCETQEEINTRFGVHVKPCCQMRKLYTKRTIQARVGSKKGILLRSQDGNHLHGDLLHCLLS